MHQHFDERNTGIRGDRLNDDVYADALNALVIACADVILVNQQEVYLGQRSIDPRRDWWLIGGRLQNGESPREAAVRHLKRDAKLDLPKSALRYLGVFSTVFARRRQPPEENGSHTLNVTFAASVTDDERIRLGPLNKDEYESSEWMTLDQVRQICEPPGAMNACLMQIVELAFSSR